MSQPKLRAATGGSSASCWRATWSLAHRSCRRVRHSRMARASRMPAWDGTRPSGYSANWPTPCVPEDPKADRNRQHPKSLGGGVNFADNTQDHDLIATENEAVKTGV